MIGTVEQVGCCQARPARAKRRSYPIIDHQSCHSGLRSGASFINPNGFTLIELLVVISILALLMAILLPTLQRVRNQAKAVACQARVRQWGLVFKMYTDANEGRWFTEEKEDDGSQGIRNWLGPTAPLWSNTRGFMGCPMATKEWDGQCYDAFTGWRAKDSTPVFFVDPSTGPFVGPIGYAFNKAVSGPPRDDPRQGTYSHKEVYWGACDVRGSARIPVFCDSLVCRACPADSWGPPLFEAGPVHDQVGVWNMCINRHDGGINMLFMDWSVRKVGLKELWTFKWHKLFNTAGPWTRQGGVEPEDWPQWMRGFKDY